MAAQNPSVPTGFCECGCGGRTTLYWGVYRRFIHGHNMKGEGPDYVVEDRGYVTPCWVWQRFLTPKGYGKLKADGEQSAHRVFYKRAKGPIPEGMTLDHLCRVRGCVNPDHLEPVTNAENRRRGDGTKLTVGDVHAIRASSGRGVDLANQYGVSQTAISNIRKRKSWRDV